MEKILNETEWNWVGKERKGRRGGGVGFLVKKEVRARVAKITRAEGLLWVETEDRRGKIFLALVYLAPGTFPRVKELNQELLDELSEDIHFFREQGRVCILGDFNCRIGELESRVGSEERNNI